MASLRYIQFQDYNSHKHLVRRIGQLITGWSSLILLYGPHRVRFLPRFNCLFKICKMYINLDWSRFQVKKLDWLDRDVVEVRIIHRSLSFGFLLAIVSLVRLRNFRRINSNWFSFLNIFTTFQSLDHLNYRLFSIANLRGSDND